MATELAKAYVQIMPSAQGIKGSISGVLNGEAASAGKTAGAGLGSNMVSVMKKLIIGAGIGKVITESLKAGADLQQSIGGIETLFGAGGAKSVEEYAAAVGKAVEDVQAEYEGLKASEERMLTYANEAYKTAGLSANEYMETVTSFAASLKQSVGGDMETLTTVANQAVVDMADNANKFGTDIGSIQNAYQGFAKQNYTMLDNLKLGYGGTKSEMERLLKDAEKLSGQKYDIKNLNDVYEAIHVIQEDLGVAGTTAKEASETFSGSLASMKSAAQNVLANLSLGNDITEPLQGLADSAYTFITKNLFPMLMNIAKQVPNLLRTVIEKGIDAADMLGGSADAFISQVMDIIMQTIYAITSNLPYIAQAAVQLIASLGQALMNIDLLDAAQHIISNLSEGLSQFAYDVLGNEDGDFLTAITDVISGMIEKFLQAAPQLLTQGVGLITSLAQGIIQGLPSVIAGAAGMMAQFIATIGENLPEILQTGIELIGQLLEGIIEAIPKIPQYISDIIEAIKKEFSEFDWQQIGDDIVEGIKNGIKNAASGLVSAAKELGSSALEGLKGMLGIHSPSTVMRDEIGKFIPAGLALGIEKNAYMVDDAMGELLGDTNAQANAVLSVSSSGRIGGQVSESSQIAAMLERYLPILAANSNVQVSLVGDARQQFKAVREQNNNYRAATGRTAF